MLREVFSIVFLLARATTPASILHMLFVVSFVFSFVIMRQKYELFCVSQDGMQFFVRKPPYTPLKYSFFTSIVCIIEAAARP